MLVRDRMTPEPITLSPAASLEDALSTMVEHSIRELPITENGELVGIITDRDVKMALGPDARTLSLSSIDPRQLDGSVEWFMTTGVKVLTEEQPLAHAIAQFLELRVGALPVIDDQGDLTGILSVTDLVKLAGELLDAQG